MLTRSFVDFLRDERGSYTLWSLVWFLLYVAIGGLAVDITDAYRIHSQLQATADASALAGVMSVGSATEDPVQVALEYGRVNMDPNIHGPVLLAPDVQVGTWLFENDTFYSNSTEPNAVYVTTRRDSQNDNQLVMSFLRILQGMGLRPSWNIVAEAVAVRYIPDCLKAQNTFLAGNQVDWTSNGDFHDVCIHGQNLIEDKSEQDVAIDLNNNNVVGEDVDISTPYLEDVTDRPNTCNNEGVCESLVEGDMMPMEAFQVGQAIAGLMDPDSGYLTEDVYSTDAAGDPLPPNYVTVDLSNDCDGTFCSEVPPEPVCDASGCVTPASSGTYEVTAPMLPNTVYVIECESPQDVLILPSPEIQPVLLDVGVSSQCRLNGQAEMNLQGVTLASSAELGSGASKPYDKAVIHFPGQVTFGLDDTCAPGGGVRIYSQSSVRVAGQGTFHGALIIARGDVELAASADSSQLSIIAGENIEFTANDGFGGVCPTGPDGEFAFRYRLVR